MVRAAVANAIPHSDDFVLELNNTAWIQPIRVDGPTEVSLILYPGNELQKNHYYEMDFEIYSGTDSREQLHCQGQAVLTRKQAPDNISLGSLQGKMDKAVLEPSDIYPVFIATGLHYGPTHRGISRIWVGERQALAELSLPIAAAQDFDKYGLHPSLMDSALQASIGLVEDPSHSALPFALERISVFSSCVEKMYALIQLSQQPVTKTGLVKYDISLCDEAGKVCVQMSGFSTRQLDRRTQPYKLHTVTVTDDGSSSEDNYYQKLIELMQDGQASVDDTVELGS
jgi:acyl transferase domain-containing protein